MKRAKARIRTPLPGDYGRVVALHGALYAREFGYDAHFEALVARIVAGFIGKLDAKRERCWIADLGGEVVGSVFLVRQGKSTAKLRLLIVHPKARGLGLGRRLTRACIAFARRKGYRRIVLWTQSHLAAARAIYESENFRMKSRKKHLSFGKRLVAETWELRL